MDRLSRKVEILLDAQIKDLLSPYCKPYIINPLKRRYLAGLTEKEITAFILKRVHNFSFRFISHAIGVHHDTVKSFISKASKKIKANCNL